VLQITVSEIVKRRNNTFSKVKSLIPSSKAAEEEQMNGRLPLFTLECCASRRLI
jgi:hypothetical protein